MDEELLAYIKSAKINTVATLRRFEYRAIKDYGYSSKLIRLYYHLSQTSYYDDYCCHFYIYTTPSKRKLVSIN